MPLMTFTTELTSEFKEFEPKDWAVLYLYNDSGNSGDELHLESTHVDNPSSSDEIATAEEYTNADMNSDNTFVDELRPIPLRLRIEEVQGDWRAYLGAVNHPAIPN